MSNATAHTAEISYNANMKSLKHCRQMLREATSQEQRWLLREDLAQAKNALANGAIAHRSGNVDEYGDEYVVAFVKAHDDSGETYSFVPCVCVLRPDYAHQGFYFLETRTLFCNDAPEVNLAKAIAAVS